MYIKQIIIDGFKSYGQRTVVEFDPKHNVIVGENGSGKSSLLLAIQFVLSRKSIPLVGDQRLDLLNEKPGHRSASVEIIFDNSDKRLPIDKKSVSIKRVIFLKSDQFFLNEEAISAADISHFLEAAGFSKSNPYYIVKQGEIAKFALIPETRLQVLYEIAGVKFYKDHKKDILITLHAIQKRSDNIQKSLDTIDKKENLLKRNAKQFKEYMNLYKEQAAIEFVIQERIINENQNELKKLENKAKYLNEDHKTLLKGLQELQEDLNISNDQITKFNKLNDRIQSEKKRFNLEQEKLLKEKNKLYVKIADLNQDIKTNNETCQKIDEKLQELNKCINETEKNLQKIQSQCEKKLSDEEEIKTKLDLNERELKELYRKRGRGSQFKNKEERDLWIKQELQTLEKQIADKNNNKSTVAQEIKDDEKEYDNLEKKIEELEMKVLIDQEKKLKQLRIERDDLRRKKDELLALSNELFKEDKNCTNELQSLNNHIAKLKRTLKSIFGVSIIDGKNSVEKVLEIFKGYENMRARLTEYHGLVIENFNCDSQLFKAVEEAAGKQLFYHIVETREFGSKILEEMNRQNFPGEVTFLPFDCLEVQVLRYPYDIHQEARPLISELVYNHKYEKPLRRIFGRTLICRDLKVATIFAEKYHFDCLTLPGDKATAKGLLKGGYFHNRHSSMKIQSEIISISNKVSFLNEKLRSIKENIEINNNDISSCISGQQNIEVKINKASNRISDIKSQINLMKKELGSKRTSIITKKNIFKEYERQLNAMFASQKSLNDELCQDMVENLSIHDQQQIENLNDSITQLKRKLRKVFNERNELDGEKSKLEDELNTKLICQKNELVKLKENISLENIREKLNSLNDELKRKQTELLRNEDYIKEQDEKANELHEQQKNEILKMEKLQLNEQKILKCVAAVKKQLENVTSKIDVVEKTIANSIKKKSELGIPNKNVYEKLNELNNDKLFKLNHFTTEQLKTYDHINKKALDQLKACSNKKKLLYSRKKEIDSAYSNIQEVINVLEERKSKAIENKFNQISKYFTDIFKKFVPNGKAYLVMKTADDANSKNNTDTPNKECDNFIGIDIMATFNRSVESKEIQHLSEGQKSLLSVAFIFAIQKCCPAPLYLFDEIDQALDFNHREAVIKVILDRSQTAQFFTISFWPEFIRHANKFHRVTFQNDTSQVQTVTREEAISFLKDQDVA